MLLNLIPDAGELARIFSQALTPAFLLAAIAAFINLLMARLRNVFDRIGSLTKAADSKPFDAHGELPNLKRRAVLLNTATYLALGAGICITLLLMTSFVSAFFKLQHIYGGVLLFVCANALLTVALYKFAQEVRAELGEIRRF